MAYNILTQKSTLSRTKAPGMGFPPMNRVLQTVNRFLSSFRGEPEKSEGNEAQTPSDLAQRAADLRNEADLLDARAVFQRELDRVIYYNRLLAQDIEQGKADLEQSRASLAKTEIMFQKVDKMLEQTEKMRDDVSHIASLSGQTGLSSQLGMFKNNSRPDSIPLALQQSPRRPHEVSEPYDSEYFCIHLGNF